MAEVVNACKGKVADPARSPLMDELLRDRWFITEGPDKTIHSTKDSRREVLWTNYEPEVQKELFE